MPRHLYLMRHSDAAPKEAGQDDKSRELTQTGMKDALHMGAWFIGQHIEFDLFVTSSAQRAEQTANLIAESMKRDPLEILIADVLYEASVRQMLDYIHDIGDDHNNVLIIGHNPAISYLAEYLTKADIGDMAAGSVAIIRFTAGSWTEPGENTGELVKYVSPAEIARF